MVLVAAGSAYYAWTDWRVSDEQVRSLAALAKRQAPSLYAHDEALGPGGAWQFESPAFGALLAGLKGLGWGSRGPCGPDDLAPVRLLTGPVVLVYLGGMYVLLYLQTRSWSVSVLVAILSSTVIHTLGGTWWGVGSMPSITASGVCIALTPWLVLGYILKRDGWGVVAVFAWIGLMGNLHVPSAMNLALVLLLVHLACGRSRASGASGRSRPRAWLQSGACAAAAVVGCLPILWHRWGLMARLRPPGAALVADKVLQAVRLAEWDALYPQVLDGVWTWLTYVAVLLLVSAVILHRGERFVVRNFATWVWCLAAAGAVALVFQGASQLLGLVLRRPPPVVTFVRASGLVMLPLYVLLAHAVTTLFRIARGHTALAWWACAVFMVGWMAPSDNLRMARYSLADTATLFLNEPDKPRYVQKHHDRYNEWREVSRIAAWARHRTPEDSVFVFDNAEFRLRSRRGLLLCRDDAGPLYEYTPWRLDAWAGLLQRQRRAPATQPAGADPLSGGSAVPPTGQTPWFLVLRTSDEAARQLKTVPPEGWGRFYQVCRAR